MQKRLRLEEAAQTKFFKFLRDYYPAIRLVTFAIPNGGYRTPSEAKRLVSGGVTKGIPDVFCAFPANGFHGLFIEFKKPYKKGEPKPSTTPEQKAKIILLNDMGYMATVCYGHHEAIECILAYWNRGPW